MPTRIMINKNNQPKESTTQEPDYRFVANCPKCNTVVEFSECPNCSAQELYPYFDLELSVDMVKCKKCNREYSPLTEIICDCGCMTQLGSFGKVMSDRCKRLKSEEKSNAIKGCFGCLGCLGIIVFLLFVLLMWVAK